MVELQPKKKLFQIAYMKHAVVLNVMRLFNLFFE